MIIEGRRRRKRSVGISILAAQPQTGPPFVGFDALVVAVEMLEHLFATHDCFTARSGIGC